MQNEADPMVEINQSRVGVSVMINNPNFGDFLEKLPLDNDVDLSEVTQVTYSRLRAAVLDDAFRRASLTSNIQHVVQLYPSVDPVDDNSVIAFLCYCELYHRDEQSRLLQAQAIYTFVGEVAQTYWPDSDKATELAISLITRELEAVDEGVILQQLRHLRGKEALENKDVATKRATPTQQLTTHTSLPTSPTVTAAAAS